MKIVHASIIIFYNDRGEVLLQDRKSNSKTGEEWGYFGGSIEEGESPEEALVREIKEELGFNLKEFEYIGEYNNEYKSNYFKNSEEVRLYRKIFIAPLKENLSKFSLPEGGGFRLFPIEEATKLKLIPGDKKALELFEEYLSK